MPREQLSIRNFNGGMIPNVDSIDINPNSAFWCKDVDLLTRGGQLIGLPGDENKTSTIGAIGWINGYGWILKSDGTYTIVYSYPTDKNVKYIENFYGTPGAIAVAYTHSQNIDRMKFIPRNQTLRANAIDITGARLTPKWYGYTDNSIFGSSSSALLVYDQECAGTFTAATNGHFYVKRVYNNAATGLAGFFSKDKNYYYKIAIEYDGFQISIIENNAYVAGTIGSDGNYTGVSPIDTETITVKIRATGGATSATAFNKRVTAILLFRAESDSNLTTPQTLFRLVDRIAISDAGWTTTDTNHKDYTLTDTGEEGDTFETLSGLSQEATASILPWAVACDADNYMFIGNCTHASLTEAPNMIFRSVAGRFDVYDFQSSAPPFIKLPARPTAMIYYFGRLLVFDLNTLYRIDPQSMTIEEVIPGYGCYGIDSLIATEMGVFFANENGIHQYDGRSIQTISGPIFEYTETVSYNVGGGSVTITDNSYRKILADSWSNSNHPRLSYYAKYDMLLFAMLQGSLTVMYGYYIPLKSWVLLSTPNPSAAGFFGFIIGKDGEVYQAYNQSADYLYKLMSNFASRKQFLWISQKLSFNEGDENQYQKVYKIYSTSSNTSAFYGIDNASLATAPTSGAVASADFRNKVFRFILAATAANAYLNNVTVIFRRMIGKR